MLLPFVPIQWTEEEDRALKEPIIKKYEKEGHPYYSSARYCSKLCCRLKNIITIIKSCRIK